MSKETKNETKQICLVREEHVVFSVAFSSKNELVDNIKKRISRNFNVKCIHTFDFILTLVEWEKLMDYNRELDYFLTRDSYVNDKKIHLLEIEYKDD